MKRKLAVILAGLCMISSLSACNGSSDMDSSSDLSSDSMEYDSDECPLSCRKCHLFCRL